MKVLSKFDPALDDVYGGETTTTNTTTCTGAVSTVEIKVGPVSFTSTTCTPSSSGSGAGAGTGGSTGGSSGSSGSSSGSGGTTPAPKDDNEEKKMKT